MIPLVDPKIARQRAPSAEPWLKAPLRIAIAVLALISLCVAGALTWQAFGQGTLIGCSESNLASCDEVLASGWSKFMGMPVALPGLVCYTAIFALSLLAGLRKPTAALWINTALVLLAILAVGAGIWFTGLQLVKIGKICPKCMAVHACGLAIGTLVLWAMISRRRGATKASASMSALAGTLGAASTGARRMSYPPVQPSLSVALVGAAMALVLLAGGQIVFQPKTYDVSTVTLDDPIELTSSTDAGSDDGVETSQVAQAHLVRRVPVEDSVDVASATAESEFEDTGGTEKNAPGEVSPDDADAADDPAPIDAPTPAKREVTFLGGKLTVEISSEAVYGPLDAPYVILELMDYTCPHCRVMHENMLLARRRYGDQLAIVIMPVPLELECNRRLPKTDPMHRGACRLARLAICVAKLDPAAFADFHNFLLRDEETPPQYGAAVVRAFRLVNRDKLRALTKSDEIEQRVQKYIKLYAALSARQKSSDKPFGLPVQIVGDKILTGKFDTPEEMFETWEAELDLRPE